MDKNRINLIRQMPYIDKCPIGDTIRASFDVTVANIPIGYSDTLLKELNLIFSDLNEWITRAMEPDKITIDNPFI